VIPSKVEGMCAVSAYVGRESARKGQPAWGCPRRGELLPLRLFSPCFCIPTRVGSNRASTRRLGARGMLLPGLGIFKVRHVEAG